MSMKELDKKIENLKKWQDKLHAELERRTKVEQEAEELICQGKMQEAMDLLNTLDDEKFRRMMESETGEIEEEEPEEEVVDTEQTEEEVDDDLKKAADCMIRHLEAYHIQSMNYMEANFGTSCSKCQAAEECGFDFIERMKPLLELSDESFTVIRKRPGVEFVQF